MEIKDTKNHIREWPSVMNRLFTISDIHVDYKENMKWVEDLRDITSLKKREFEFASRQLPDVDEIDLHNNDVLVVSGDVSDNTQKCIETLKLLSTVFGLLFFVPGNHDLWIHRGDNYKAFDVTEADSKSNAQDKEPKCHPTRPLTDSLDKLHYLINACEDLNIQTKPTIVKFNRNYRETTESEKQEEVVTILVVPILSWHHVSWDIEPDVCLENQALEFRNVHLPCLEQMIMDYSRTKWPSEIFACYSHKCLSQTKQSNCVCPDMKRVGHRNLKDSKVINESEAIAYFVDQLNDRRCSEFQWSCKPISVEFVVSFSHFAPNILLLPEKNKLLYPPLMKASGSTFLKRRVERLSPDVHIFGHIHFGWDMTLNQTRFVQACLAYPHERRARMGSLVIGTCPNAPLKIFENGKFVKAFQAKMSEQYKTVARTPDDTVIASWVEDTWRRFLS